MSDGLRWTILMTAFGIVTSIVVFLLTGSVGWAIVGLLGAGVVANAVLRPARRRS
jgi:hypothetical protein